MKQNNLIGDDPVIQAVTPANIDDVIQLVLDVFDSDVARTMSAEGVATFTSSSPNEQRKGLADRHVFLAAVLDDQVVGVVRLNRAGHLYLLFVDSAYQGHGIGKKLLTTSLEALRQHDSGIERVTLNASLNAVDVYRHWGCKVTGAQIIKKGVRVIPMELSIREFLSR